jgi:hypothetical protein
MKVFKSIFGVSNAKTEKQPKTEKPKAKDKPKGKTKGKEKVEPKKRGRPTNAELAAKARIEKEADIAFRKELLERQKAAVSGSLVVTASADDSTVATNNPNWVPPWPIFLPGQRVESIFKRGDGKTEKGTVGKDDVNCPSIRVKWDDGSSQYAAKLSLKLIVRKTYEKVFTKSRSKKEA